MRRQQVAAYQAESSVAPGTPDSGISNAYRRVLSENLVVHLTHKAVLVVVVGDDPSAMLGMSSGFMYDTGSRTSNQKYTGKRISLDFVNANIHSIFQFDFSRFESEHCHW